MTRSANLLNNCVTKIATRGLIFSCVILSSLLALALPKDLSKYDVIEGGLSIIEDGAYVEGSAKNGGIQPDYRIDLNSEPLKSLLEKASRIGKQRVSYWDKVGLIVELVRQDFFKYTDYKNPYYRQLLKKYRSAMLDIPLSEYGVCSAGVCREHALVLHFALKAAGIKNKHAYAEIFRSSVYHNYEVTEDHAFTVVKYKGTDWVVDAYYWGFNGFRLQDLMTSEGITENSLQAPIADPAPGFRRIIKVNNFPRVYNPKANTVSCSKVLFNIH